MAARRAHRGTILVWSTRAASPSVSHIALALFALALMVDAAWAQPLPQRGSDAAPVAPAAAEVAPATETAPQNEPPQAAAETPPVVAADSKPLRTGHLIRLPNPITGVEQIRRQLLGVLNDARRQGTWPVLVLEMQPGRCELGQAIDLARLLSGPELNGATTVAYLPQGLVGHGLLAAIACDEIVTSAAAQIGDAGKGEEAIGPELRTIYKEIAERRKTVPSDLVLAMLDPAVELLQVETEVSREYVLQSRLDEVRGQRAIIKSNVVKAAGEPGVFNGARARELGIVSALAEDRIELARALDLKGNDLVEDPSLGTSWRPIRIDIRGPIHTTLVRQIERMVGDQIRRHDVNFIVFWMDSEGGSPADSIALANTIADLDPARRRTVAYIPKGALADAAFIAAACDQVVLGPDAKLGGNWPKELEAEELAAYAVPLGEIARRKFRSPALIAAFADVSQPVYRYVRRDGMTDYLTDQGAAELEQRNPGAWRREEEVVAANVPLQLGAERAKSLGLVRNVVDDFDQIGSLYGLERSPALLEPSWVEDLIDALNSPGVAWLLLLVGGAGLYIELQSPGIGLGGFLALVCFVLFFWSHYLGGTATWLEILLFLAGAVCLLLELFILPGFGVFGLGGGLLIIASLVLASQTFVFPRHEYEVPQLLSSMLVISGVFVGFTAGAVFARRYLQYVPMLNRVILEPATGLELEQIARREALVDYSHLVGHAGVTTTPLSPSGKAHIGSDHLDVMTEGEFVPRGTAVTVVRVRGNQVLVRVQDTPSIS